MEGSKVRIYFVMNWHRTSPDSYVYSSFSPQLLTRCRLRTILPAEFMVGMFRDSIKLTYRTEFVRYIYVLHHVMWDCAFRDLEKCYSDLPLIFSWFIYWVSMISRCLKQPKLYEIIEHQVIPMRWWATDCTLNELTRASSEPNYNYSIYSYFWSPEVTAILKQIK